MYQSLSSGHVNEPEKFEESGFPMLNPSPLSEAAQYLHICWVAVKPILFNSIIPGNIPSWYELLDDEKSSERNTERVHN